MTADELENKLLMINQLLFVNYQDFKPVQIYFDKKDNDHLICDFISNQIDVTNCFKYLEINKIDTLRKLIIKYVEEHDEEQKMKDKKIYCDQCGKEITDEVYYIGDDDAAMNTNHDSFCSERCILDYLMVDSEPVEDWNE